jgi:hypothetical protein
MRTKSENGNGILPKKMIYDNSTATNVVFAFASCRSMYVSLKKLLLLLLFAVVVVVTVAIAAAVVRK